MGHFTVQIEVCFVHYSPKTNFLSFHRPYLLLINKQGYRIEIYCDAYVERDFVFLKNVFEEINIEACTKKSLIEIHIR